jgi:two-component system, OmpR family, phosphate regulon sensor histidine kinase PhoR
MNKNKFLIFGCVFAVLALLVIQCYFIFNTYQLKEREIKFEVKSTLEKLDDRENFEKSNFKDDTEQALLIDFQNKLINEKQLIEKLQKLEVKHSEIAMKYIETQFKSTAFQVGYSKNISSIVTITGNKKDTIINKNIELYKSKTPLINKLVLTKSSWHTSSENSSSTDSIKKTNKKYEYEVRKIYNYSINNLQYLVLSQMIGLLIISFLLMVFIVFLIYYLIKNLLTVNKISETQRDFINNISHEFKTPLATLSIATKTLQNNFLDSESSKTTIAIIERQNERLQKILNQVDFNLVLKNVENAKTDNNINQDYIENCLNDFKIANPEIEILSEIDSGIDLTISKFHFNTIVSNLLENAVKYGGTNLEISMKLIENSYVLKIKDNGIGIPKSEQKYIFEKFYRVSNGDVHNTKGLGLGLFYTKEIIEIYNGKIDVESSDNGSEFIISIPK